MFSEFCEIILILWHPTFMEFAKMCSMTSNCPIISQIFKNFLFQILDTRLSKTVNYQIAFCKWYLKSTSRNYKERSFLSEGAHQFYFCLPYFYMNIHGAYFSLLLHVLFESIIQSSPTQNIHAPYPNIIIITLLQLLIQAIYFFN